MQKSLSVIIPTHRPQPERLTKVFEGLRKQTLALDEWELLIVENNETQNLDLSNFSLEWHADVRKIHQPILGLTHARQAGMSHCTAPLFVLVDDDNILDPRYLETCLQVFREHPQLGLAGGKCLPQFETAPPEWIGEFWTSLALRDLGSEQILSKTHPQEIKEYPAFAPIGAGMCGRTKVLEEYFKKIAESTSRIILDRTGKNLSSGGDNDIVLSTLTQGLEVGYFPQLQVTHLIPASRLTRDYLTKVNYASSRSWIHVLDKYQLLPWPKTSRFSACLRKGKAFFTYRAWRNSVQYIRWRGACGLFDGCADVAPMKSTLRHLGRTFGLGKLVYFLVHAPRSHFLKVQERGFLASLGDTLHHRSMKIRAGQLPTLPVNRSAADILGEIHVLTGAKYLHQTNFCLYSLQLQLPGPIRPVLYDDGSLSRHHQESFKRIFPKGRIVSAHEIEQQLDQQLPADRFPSLRARRLEYPHLRKLTDVHSFGTDWKMVLDSDMLFFHTPHEILAWLESPIKPIHLTDIETTYGYEVSYLSKLCGHSVPERVNVGICGLSSSELDWEEIEHWCRRTLEEKGSTYYQEQALVAMLVAGSGATVLPAETYVVLPQENEVKTPQAILHHYVAESKPWYFRYGWRHIWKETLQES